MRRLPRPPYSARTALGLCIESIENIDLTERLALIADELEDSEAEYLERGEQGTLFSIAQSVGVGHVTMEEMKRVYKGTFARSARTRNIYDRIKKLPANDICPLCGQRTVGTLDHYLTQSNHSALIITPINLVPACADCNKVKLDAQPGTADEQPIHPYFDDVDNEVWLYASVEESTPAAVVFCPQPPAEWPETKRARIVNHFRLFGLGALYASHSAVELVNIRYGLQRIAERGTPADIRAELLRRAESSEAAQINSWQTATYYALAESNWFCAGGYN